MCLVCSLMLKISAICKCCWSSNSERLALSVIWQQLAALVQHVAVHEREPCILRHICITRNRCQRCLVALKNPIVVPHEMQLQDIAIFPPCHQASLVHEDLQTFKMGGSTIVLGLAHRSACTSAIAVPIAMHNTWKTFPSRTWQISLVSRGPLAFLGQWLETLLHLTNKRNYLEDMRQW